jgi:hypothetical protein
MSSGGLRKIIMIEVSRFRRFHSAKASDHQLS